MEFGNSGTGNSGRNSGTVSNYSDLSLLAPAAIALWVFENLDIVGRVAPGPAFPCAAHLPRLIRRCPVEISCWISDGVLAKPLIDQFQKQRLESILGVPLIAGNAVGGAIHQPAVFREKRLEIMLLHPGLFGGCRFHMLLTI